MITTRAALFHAVGEPFTVEKIELAEPGPRDVVVRMAAVGICGTDLHQVKGEFRRPTPMVLGHEGSGIVERIGGSVTSVREGDDVVLSWAPSCGACGDCRRGRPAACTALHAAIGAGTLVDGTTGMTWKGATLYRGTATGCLAELVVVDERVALPLRGAVPLDQAALLGCAALTGVGAALFAATIGEGTCVLVLGAGGVGLFCIQGARIAGAETIIAVDPVPARREQARTLGATHSADPAELDSVLAAVAPEGADVAFEVVGSTTLAELALRHTRSHGTTVLVGIPPAGQRLDLDPAQLLRREKWLTGTMYGSEDPAVALPILLEHVRSGGLQLEPLLGPVFSLDDIDAAMQASLGGAAGRVVVRP